MIGTYNDDGYASQWHGGSILMHAGTEPSAFDEGGPRPVLSRGGFAAARDEGAPDCTILQSLRLEV